MGQVQPAEAEAAQGPDGARPHVAVDRARVVAKSRQSLLELADGILAKGHLAALDPAQHVAGIRGHGAKRVLGGLLDVTRTELAAFVEERGAEVALDVASVAREREVGARLGLRHALVVEGENAEVECCLLGARR